MLPDRPVPSLLEALHELVQQHHLATGHDKPVHSSQVVLTASVLLLGALKEEGVVAALLELSDHIQQGDLTALTTLQAMCVSCMMYVKRSLCMKRTICIRALFLIPW